MNDDKQPNPDATQPPVRTPNREFRRQPPVIDGESSPVRAEPGSAAKQPDTDDENTPTPPTTATPETGTAEAASETPDPAPEPIPPEPARAPEAQPAGKPVSRGYGFGAVATASLVSAGLAALAVFGVQSVNAPAGPSPSALAARIADLDRRVAANLQTPQVSPADIAALDKRVASVETLASGASAQARKAAEAAARPAAADPQAASSSQQALDALGARIAALENDAKAATSNLDERLASLEQAISAPKTEERAAESRIEPAPPPDVEPLRKQLAAQMAALDARLQDVERQAAPLAEGARAAQARFKSLEERIQPLAGRIDESRAHGAAELKRAEALAERSADAARIALAQSVSAAIATGAPFAAQVEALERFGVPAERLAPLASASTTGVPTAEELARALAALEPAIVARTEAPADASVLDRLTNSALGLVRVRPTGEAEGDAPADLFARMMRSLQRGDVAAALKEREILPDRAKAASANWAKRAQSRVDAEQAARALLADQVQKLGRS